MRNCSLFIMVKKSFETQNIFRKKFKSFKKQLLKRLRVCQKEPDCDKLYFIFIFLSIYGKLRNNNFFTQKND